MGSFYGSFGITPDDDAPELVVQPNGRVYLVLGDFSLHFPSLPAYDAWQETVDRSRAALGQQYHSIDAYQVRDLREEKQRVVQR